MSTNTDNPRHKLKPHELITSFRVDPDVREGFLIIKSLNIARTPWINSVLRAAIVEVQKGKEFKKRRQAMSSR